MQSFIFPFFPFYRYIHSTSSIGITAPPPPRTPTLPVHSPKIRTPMSSSSPNPFISSSPHLIGLGKNSSNPSTINNNTHHTKMNMTMDSLPTLLTSLTSNSFMTLTWENLHQLSLPVTQFMSNIELNLPHAEPPSSTFPPSIFEVKPNKDTTTAATTIPESTQNNREKEGKYGGHGVDKDREGMSHESVQVNIISACTSAAIPIPIGSSSKIESSKIMETTQMNIKSNNTQFKRNENKEDVINNNDNNDDDDIVLTDHDIALTTNPQLGLFLFGPNEPISSIMNVLCSRKSKICWVCEGGSSWGGGGLRGVVSASDVIAAIGEHWGIIELAF